MVGQSDLRWVLIAVLAVGVFGAAGPGASLAQFSDEHAGTGTATAASKFGGTGGGDDVQAFDDANGNGIRDDGEATYSKAELQNFDDPDVDLVIPAGVGSIEANGQDAVSITAGSISSAVDVGAHKQDVRLVATDGDVDVAGSNLTVDKKYGRVNVTAAGDVHLSNATLVTQSGSIVVESDGAATLDDAALRVEGEDGHVSVTGRSVSATDVDVDTVTGTIDLRATEGAADFADGALAVDGGDGAIVLSGSDDVDLAGVTATTNAGRIRAESGGRLTLDGATARVATEHGNVSATAQFISARQADLATQNGSVVLGATAGGGGPLDATGATLTVNQGWGAIKLRSVGNATLDSATLATANAGATVDLGTGSSTLFVENVTVDDDDGTLEYSPSDAIERPERDDVAPAG